ncbi:MAG TPA: carbonic anhydrase [Phycisphaerales bacterium]|nr:carbonic anhydrase [Phycisphaerales bacterium]
MLTAMNPIAPATKAPRASAHILPGGPVAVPMTNYTSPIKYDSARIHAAALYCSDGRIGEQFDDFLQTGLGLPRYDRIALPGGPACLAGHPQAHLEEQGVVDELRFLVEVHKLKRVVLIQHQSCAFYAARLELKEPRLELLQKADLVRAAAYVHRVTGLDAVEAYFARLADGKMTFEPVQV